VSGKSWFDKQGGPYTVTNLKTQWEGFSLRFYDNEEIMLFSFPQSNYYDGTYISKDAKGERLNNYALKTTKHITHSGLKWSSGWDLSAPGIKEEYYAIIPIKEGNINFSYFEEICYIKNRKGEEVGLCFAELLPGVLNAKTDSNPLQLFKRVEF
jgi:hypothetical protein